MAVSGPKSLAPIEQQIISPINQSTTFTAGNTIIFRLSSSDIQHWLVQDSYFVFDVEWTNASGDDLSKDLVIRNSSSFFRTARIIHGGNEVYYSQYNIAQQFLDYIKTGDDFLKANYNEWTSHKTYEDALANDKAVYPLILRADELTAGASITRKGVIMHVSQILKCFSQCENFPMKNCPQAIDVELQLAQPNEFLCAVEEEQFHNFYDVEGNGDATVANNTGAMVGEAEVPVEGIPTYIIKNMRLYMMGAVVQESYAAVVSASNASGQGLMWEFTMPRINLRNEPAHDPGYLISNFQCITENVDKLYVWGVRGHNLGTAVRPHLTNMNLRFGPHQLPKSPTAEDNWYKPAIYKALVDDTLEYDTAYYTSANSDISNAYYPLILKADGTPSTYYHYEDVDIPPPHDAHLLMAASFTTDDNHPGAPSSMWNSQYNLHYQLLTREPPITWVLAVDTKNVLSLRNGMLSSTNV